MHRGKLLLALTVAALIGCSRSDADKLGTVKAGGTVTLNGQPLAGATVTFSPTSAGRAASAMTDSQGRFTLNTSNTISGVMPGSYAVGIAKETVQGAMTPEESQAYYEKNKQPPPAPKVTNEVPEKYKSPTASGLKAEVKAGDSNDFKFDLTK